MAQIGFEPADKQENFEEGRRTHFFRGLTKEQYHKYFDGMYHLSQEKRQKNKIQEEQFGHFSPIEYTDQPRKKAKFTLRQDTFCFKIWNILKLIVCLVTTLLYPYYSVNGFPPYYSN